MIKGINGSTALLIIAGLVLLFLASVQLIEWNVYHIILWKMIVGLGGSMILGSALFVICKISDNIHGQEMIEKNYLFCRSENEMDRRADELIERGYKVKRETSVFPIHPFVFKTYKVIFWK